MDFDTQKSYRESCQPWLARRHLVPFAFRLAHETIPSYEHGKPEKHSIPIERPPAQFNAFYPQCSGSGFGPSSEGLSRRSIADRILCIIVSHSKFGIG
jgi:hypothetical protein